MSEINPSGFSLLHSLSPTDFYFFNKKIDSDTLENLRYPLFIYCYYYFGSSAVMLVSIYVHFDYFISLNGLEKMSFYLIRLEDL